MKPAFYEPSVCMCTPGNPNTMGVCVTLTEPVNGAALRKAVEQLRERFPYLYVRVKLEGSCLIVVPNDLPVVIRSTWDPILLCSEEANFHLLSFKYEGSRLTAEVSHSITDGAGFLPYFKSVMYCYLSIVIRPDSVCPEMKSPKRRPAIRLQTSIWTPQRNRFTRSLRSRIISGLRLLKATENASVRHFIFGSRRSR